jgi:hypothetical protein
MRLPENSQRDPLQKCDHYLCAAPAEAFATAADKHLSIKVIFVFQADRRRSGRPCTYANMQYAPLNRCKKCLAILNCCLFLWQNCNIDGEFYHTKKAGWGYSTASAGRRVPHRERRYMSRLSPGGGGESRSQVPAQPWRVWHRVCYKSSDDGMGMLRFGRQD